MLSRRSNCPSCSVIAAQSILSPICSIPSEVSDAVTPTLFESTIKSLPFLHRGKVRDIYAVGEDKLLVIQSDRLSAFDVILPDPIPGKGHVLTAMSNFWFAKLGHVIPNHLTHIAPESVVDAGERDQVIGRAMVVRKFKPLMIEAVVRGYIIGSGWKDYQKSGTVCGIKLPPGLKKRNSYRKSYSHRQRKRRQASTTRIFRMRKRKKLLVQSMLRARGRYRYSSTVRRRRMRSAKASLLPIRNSNSARMKPVNFSSSMRS